MRSFTDVHDELAARGVPHEVVHLPSSSRTAQMAADALGVPLSAVVKSLVFLLDGERAVLVLVGGDASVDTDALAREAGATRVALASGEQVLELTGYAVGGVPPFALATALPIIADPGVCAAEVVYCGGGSTATMVEIGGADLEAVLEPRKAAVARRS